MAKLVRNKHLAYSALLLATKKKMFYNTCSWRLITTTKLVRNKQPSLLCPSISNEEKYLMTFFPGDKFYDKTA